MARSKLIIRASIVVYGKVPALKGWRRGTLVSSRNNRICPGVMQYDGQTVPVAPGAVFQIRRFENGKTIYTTVGTDLQVAQTALDKYLLSEQHRVTSAALGLIEPEKVTRLTLDEHIKAYLAEKTSDKISGELLLLYERVLMGVAGFSRRTYAEEITQTDITGYLDRLQAYGYTVGADHTRHEYSQRTMQGRYVAIRGFLHKECGIAVDKLIDKATHRRRSRKPDPDATEYSQHETDALLAVMDEYHRSVFTVMLLTGLRYRELSHLTWHNVKFERGIIHIPGEETVHKTVRGRTLTVHFETKNHRSRDVPMFESLRPILLAWREQHPDTTYVFGTRRDLPDGHWLEALKKYGRKAGLNCGICEHCAERNECEHIYVHRWRHTFAHRCIFDGGVPLHMVSRWLGHQDVSITARVYLHGGDWPGTDPFAGKVHAPATKVPEPDVKMEMEPEPELCLA